MFVMDLAARHGLSGWAQNAGREVRLEVEGSATAVAAFLNELRARAPALARVEDIEVHDLPRRGETGFQIRASEP